MVGAGSLVSELNETNDELTVPGTTPWLRVRHWLGWALRGAFRGDNSGILIGTVIVIVGIFAVALRNTGFMTTANLLAIIRISTTTTVMAAATVYVLCASEIDLSIASIIPVSALIAAVLLSWHCHFLVAAAAAVAFGAIVGLANGLGTVFFRIPSFAVTLGSMGVMQGLAQIVTHADTIPISDDRFLFWFGSGSVGPVPILAFWSFGALVIGEVLLSYTALGRRVLATGANANAARFSGIRTGRVKAGVMVASGAAGALAGVLYDGQYAAGDFTLGSTDLLSVIAAAIVGGCSLSGGKGSVVGAVLASLLVGALNNGLVLAGFGAPGQLMVQGIIIVVAVIISSRNASGRLWRWLAAPEEGGRDLD
jgi:ribose transport system permease protein